MFDTTIATRRIGYTRFLERVPEAFWPKPEGLVCPPIEVWRSRHFLVVVYLDNGYERLSVNRTALRLGSDSRYQDGISRDDLQRLKAECGRGDRWAVEVFPPGDEIVNVQNMRHLFILRAPPEYGWKKAG